MRLRCISCTLVVVLAADGSSASSKAAETSILVAYDTRTGNTERLAQAVADGVGTVEDVDIVSRLQADVTDADILGAEGILVGTPVHWGSTSAKTKEFLERVANVLLAEKELGPEAMPRLRTAGAFVTAGAVSSGKELARTTILTAFLQMQFIVIGGVDADGFGTLGPQATTGDADPGLSEAELAEARTFGKRFAELTLKVTQECKQGDLGDLED